MTIISRSPFVPHDLESLKKGVFPTPIGEGVYNQWCKKYSDINSATTERIIYNSDGLAVTGVISTPKHIPDGGLPILIFNRGGMRNYGMLTALQVIQLLAPLAESGYIVLASNYRGNDGSEGQEQFGGDDVNDILNLLELGKSLTEWDNKSSYMMGWSRGGMMTLLALKAGADVKAASIIAPITDMELSAKERPDLLEYAYKKLIPHTNDDELQEQFLERSAIHWADKIDVPLHIQHGNADDTVTIPHSHKLVSELERYNKSHDFFIHEGGNHFLNRERETLLDLSTNWLSEHY